MIRDAAPHDAPAIASLVNLAYRVEDFFVRGDRTDEDEIRAMLARGAFLLLEEEDRLTGCVFVDIAATPRGYFGMLSVDPERQSRGRGRRLIAAAEARCRAAGCAEVDILVVDRRVELASFYRRLGFVPVGTQPWAATHVDRLKLPCHLVRYRKALV